MLTKISEETAWFAGSLVCAVIIKLLYEDPTKETVTRRQKAFSVFSGVFLAVFGTETVAEFTNVSSFKGIALVAAGISLTGDHFMRLFISAGPKLSEQVMEKIYRAFGGDSNDQN